MLNFFFSCLSLSPIVICIPHHHFWHPSNQPHPEAVCIFSIDDTTLLQEGSSLYVDNKSVGKRGKKRPQSSKKRMKREWISILKLQEGCLGHHHHKDKNVWTLLKPHVALCCGHGLLSSLMLLLDLLSVIRRVDSPHCSVQMHHEACHQFLTLGR
jgi:hypothetical protein